MPYLNSARGIELDPHRRQRAAADRDLADARRPGTASAAARSRRRRRSRPAQGLGGQRQDQDRRVGRIDLAIGRIGAQARRQVGARRVDRRLHVARRAVDVAVEVELQGDAGRADGAARGHLGDVGDLAEMALERRRDAGRHDLRAGAGHAGACTEMVGKVDLRQRRHRQLEERDGAGGRDPERQQGGRDRPPDEGRREVHSAGLPCSASRTAASTLK